MTDATLCSNISYRVALSAVTCVALLRSSTPHHTPPPGHAVSAHLLWHTALRITRALPEQTVQREDGHLESRRCALRDGGTYPTFQCRVHHGPGGGHHEGRVPTHAQQLLGLSEQYGGTDAAGSLGAGAGDGVWVWVWVWVDPLHLYPNCRHEGSEC